MTAAASSPLRALAALALCTGGLGAQQGPLVSLHDFTTQEVRHQGFTLARPQQVRLKVTGQWQDDWVRDGRALATGWILNAATREVVWQMDGRNIRRDGRFRVAEQTLDLPAGSYEAYFSHHAYREFGVFFRPSHNLDRRSQPRYERKWSWWGGESAPWREDVLRTGLDLSVADPSAAATFEAPLRWRNIVVSLLANADGRTWTQAFTVKKPVQVHVYAQGEATGRRMADAAWILDAKSREVVWEMSPDKAQYAGGAEKNRRQVETLSLPAGEYIASYATDGSHSPADWNEAPPCDPLNYGLLLSVPQDKDVAALVPHAEQAPGPVLAELVRVGNDQNLSTPFTLAASATVRVYALGEGEDDDLADEGWIEDASERRVWEMARIPTRHAGGATKNRLVDTTLTLPKGAYTLRYRSDDSHAYGHWNSAAPWDGERYGITVFASK